MSSLPVISRTASTASSSAATQVSRPQSRLATVGLRSGEQRVELQDPSPDCLVRPQGPSPNPRPSWARPRPLLLFPCLDRPRPNGANPRDRLLGVNAGFGQQSRRDHARASEAATTMNEDVFAGIETRPKVIADRRPSSLELQVWRAHIGDGQVQPFDPTTLNFLAKHCDCEPGQLVRLEERDDRPGAPGSDRVQVLFEIPRPRSADREPIVLPGR